MNLKDPENPGRRKFISRIWGILGMVAFGEMAFYTLSMLRPGNKKLKDNPAINVKVAGNVDDFPLNSVNPDRVNRYYLLRNDDGGFLALSLTCPHLGCSVLWDEKEGQFVCPCHSSSFDRLGNVIDSPAPRPLDYYPVIIEGGKVKIDLTRKLVRRKFEKHQVTYAI